MVSVRESFKNKTIFVTGATGFLGKALIESILRNCDVKRCYVLIRPQKGLMPGERLEKLFRSPIWERLRAEKPQEFQKVHLIQGDLLASGEVLGMSPENVEVFRKEVQIVLHIGASVKFNMPLSEALASNTSATLKLMRLAQTCVDMQCFLHCSTAYVNTPGVHTESAVQVPPCMNKARLEDVNEGELLKLVGASNGYANTYTLSKALTEHLLLVQHGSLPLAIARCSIVMPAVRDPFPGWIDQNEGAVACFLAVGYGLVIKLPLAPHTVMDAIPVDIVINGCLSATSACVSGSDVGVIEIPEHITELTRQFTQNPTSPLYSFSTSSPASSSPPSSSSLYSDSPPSSSSSSSSSSPLPLTPFSKFVLGETPSQCPATPVPHQGPVSVFHMTTSGDNPFNSRLIYDQVKEHFRAYPMKDQIHYPMLGYISDQKKAVQLVDRTTATMNVLNKIMPKNKLWDILYAMQSRVQLMYDQLTFFGANKWTFTNLHVMRLSEKLRSDDRLLFPVHVMSSPAQCIEVMCFGISKYIVPTFGLPDTYAQFKALINNPLPREAARRAKIGPDRVAYDKAQAEKALERQKNKQLIPSKL